MHGAKAVSTRPIPLRLVRKTRPAVQIADLTRALSNPCWETRRLLDEDLIGPPTRESPAQTVANAMSAVNIAVKTAHYAASREASGGGPRLGHGDLTGQDLFNDESNRKQVFAGHLITILES